ncbi:YbaB/EbfC family nucleoid-associated protein [Nocardia sp. NPDC019219]|uniref:YbaB/EbfC family nucleoid-associated protein n=1 Tax=Nocardia sp. NPDC019219 TaxID=3154590 RepID=UPI0033DB7D39
MAAFDVHHAAEDLARMAADFERRAERFQELESRMRALTVTEAGKDDRVRVTVDSSGAPTAIDLSPSSRGMDPAVLSAEIMACLRRAQSALRIQVGELVRNTVGDDEAGAAITAQYAERFPDPEPRTSAPFEDRAASASSHSPSMTSSPFPSGSAGDAYRNRATDLIDQIAGAGGVAATLGEIMDTASKIVKAFRKMVQDILTSLAGAMIGYTLELAASLGAAGPHVAAAVIARIGRDGLKISTLLLDMAKAFKDVQTLTQAVAAVIYALLGKENQPASA